MRRLTWMAALCMTCGLLTACDVDSDSMVLARNLSTGEVQSFAEGSVPPDWMPCTSADCPIPPTVPCQQLGTSVCTLNPECRLKELWCQGTGCACPACEAGATCPPCTCPAPTPPVCEYTCIPKLPLLCEELTDEKQCTLRTDCEWDDGMCPTSPCQVGQVCPPVTCPKVCRTKAPPICQTLDQKACSLRSDCQWGPAACPAICLDDGKGGCLPCPSTGVCGPKIPVPPPCPEIAPRPPTYCNGGKIIEQKDANGCVIGYTCELPNEKACSDLNLAYIAAVNKAKTCNPYSMTPVQECGKLVESALFCPICPSFVSLFATVALAEMDKLRLQFIALGCDKIPRACPAIACQAPKSASCLPTAGTAGICTPDQP